MNPGAEEGGRGGGAKERQRQSKMNSIPKTTSGNENELHCTAAIDGSICESGYMDYGSGQWTRRRYQSINRSVVVGALMESQHLSGS